MNAACCHANCQAHSMFLRVSSSRAIVVSRGRISRRSAFEIRAGSSTKNTHILPIRTVFCAWVCRPYVGVSPQKYDVSPCVAIFFCPSGSEFHAPPCYRTNSDVKIVGGLRRWKSRSSTSAVPRNQNLWSASSPHLR
jgi:hypothetical protein